MVRAGLPGRVTGAFLAIALVAGVFYWYSRSNPQPKPITFTVKKGDLTVKLTELGELRALESVTILAQKDGPLAYLVPEGTTVKPGDVLVRFDASQHELALRTSQVELRVAQAELQRAQRELEAQRQKLLADLARLEGELRLAQLEVADLKKKPLPQEIEKARLEVEKAKLAFENAERKLRVLPDLVEKGFITRNTLEETQLAHLAAKVELQASRFNLEKVSAGATPEELEKATIRLEQARAALQRAESAVEPQLQALQAAVDRERANVARAEGLIEKPTSELAKTVLRAPQGGLVVYAKASETASSEKIHLGMMAFAGQPLLYLPDVSSMVVDAEVNEVDLRKLRRGAPAEVRLEAYPGTLFRGRVLEIGALARLRRNRVLPDPRVKVFDVTVQIDQTDARLRPGATAMVDIIVDRRTDVVMIPLSAVAGRAGEPVAFVLQGGGVRERPVALGPSDDRFVVVTEGLRPGDEVVLTPPPPPSQ